MKKSTFKETSSMYFFQCAKKTSLILFMLTISLLSYGQKDEYRFQDTQARSVEVISNAYVKPMVGELKVLRQGTQEYQIRLQQQDLLDLGMKNLPFEAFLNNVRSYATYAATQQEHCDVIIAAVYNIRNNTEGGGLLVTVKGFPANFVEWRTATETDLTWIHMEQDYQNAKKKEEEKDVRK